MGCGVDVVGRDALSFCLSMGAWAAEEEGGEGEGRVIGCFVEYRFDLFWGLESGWRAVSHRFGRAWEQ